MEIRRDFYLKKLIESRNNGLVKVITGVRRCGKSYLLNPIFRNYLLENGLQEAQIIEIDLDKIENYQLRNPLILDEYIRNKIKDKLEYVIFIDEIQKCEAVANPAFDASLYANKSDIPCVTFYDVLNSLLHLKNVDIFVTGSNSKLLSNDIMTDFRGRGWQIHLWPLSFKEFYETNKGDKQDAFMEYIRYGGMPLVATLLKEQDKVSYLKNLFEETYYKDVVEHHHLPVNNQLRELASVLASTTGSLVSVNSLVELFRKRIDKGISKTTIDNYVDCLKDSFLINEVRRFDIRGNKLIDAQKKFYYIDSGLRNSLLNFKQIDKGFLTEMIIFNELNRLGYSVNIGMIELYRNDEKGIRRHYQYEIDFTAELGNKRFYLQSVFAIPSREKLEQESKSLININDAFKKILIEPNGYKGDYDQNGVLHVSPVEFLLNADEYLV